MSTGLVSKRRSSGGRPRDSGFSMGGAASPLPSQPMGLSASCSASSHLSIVEPAPTAMAVEDIGGLKQLPDTPIKKNAFGLASTKEEGSSSSSDSSSPAPIPLHLHAHHATPLVDLQPPVASTEDASLPPSAPPSAWRRPTMFRRRSSGQLSSYTLASGGGGSSSVSPKTAVPGSMGSGSGSSSGSSGRLQGSEGEPMTPTRSAGAATQLVTTPCESPGTPAMTAFPSPYFVPSMTASASAPLGLTPALMTPVATTFGNLPRTSYPFTHGGPASLSCSTASDSSLTRPAQRHRHSGSVLLTLRQQESQTPSHFDTNYTLLRAIGNGEFSNAFEVFDRPRCGVYAVKRTKHPFGGYRERLRRLEEVDILRSLTSGDSPNSHVIRFVDAWEQSGHLFIQTELCAGGNLAVFLEEYGMQHEVLDEARVWKILAELTSGVSHLHDRNVIHLDLKPANVFVTAEGQLKLGDFGLATRWPRADALSIVRGAAVPSTMSGGGWIGDVWPAMVLGGERRTRAKSNGDAPEDLEREGDREYIAPEILAGQYGKEADIFSLGLIILEAAANVVLPDNGPAWHKLRSNDLSDVDLSRLSSDLVALLPGLLHKLPERRLAIDGVAAHPVVAQLLPDGAAQGAIVEETDGFLYAVFSAAYKHIEAASAPASNNEVSMEVDS